MVKALAFNHKDRSWDPQNPVMDGWVWQPMVNSASEDRDSGSLEQDDSETSHASELQV